MDDRIQQDDRITVSVVEACRLTGLSRAFLYELMAQGALRFTCVGRRRLIFVRSLREMLAEREAA